MYTHDALPAGVRHITEQLQILVSSGTGAGPTQISAFHAALRDAGVADFNVIALSSVIPEGAIVTRASPASVGRGAYGDRLYAVIADSRVRQRGETAAAALGWWQDRRGCGVFVEHIGSSEDDVRASAVSSLRAIYEMRRDVHAIDGEPELFTVSASVACTGQPVCAVVVASYSTVGWREPS